MPTIHQIAVVALIAAFIILFLGKTGLREKARNACDEAGISIIAEMLDCDFCLSFWTCLLVISYLCLFGYDINVFTIVCAPPITRYIL